MSDELLSIIKPFLDEEKYGEICDFLNLDGKFDGVYMQMMESLIDMFPHFKNLVVRRDRYLDSRHDIIMALSRCQKIDDDFKHDVLCSDLSTIGLEQVWYHENFDSEDKEALLAYLKRLQLLAFMIREFPKSVISKILEVCKFVCDGKWQDWNEIKAFSDLTLTEDVTGVFSSTQNQMYIEKYLVVYNPQFGPFINVMKTALYSNEPLDEQNIMKQAMDFVGVGEF